MSHPTITALLGPTNTGKTHRAILRMLDHHTGMMGLPLRLLAREVYDKVRQQIGDAHTALITGEEKIVPATARYFICTVEAMPKREVDFVAVDEVQLMSNHERGDVFTDRLLNTRGMKETWFMGSDAASPLVQQLAPTAQIQQHPRLSRLSFNGRVALSQLQPRSALIAFTMRDVYELAERVRVARGGAAVVLGALSPRTRNRQVEMFQSGEVNYLVATDAIGMGLNLDLAHVAFSALDKFDGRTRRSLELSEIGQIAGRAGRWLHNGTFGTIGNLELPMSAAKAIELQQFPPLRHAFYRNSALDFSSLEALRVSLTEKPRHRFLLPVRDAQDHAALDWFMQQKNLSARVSGAKDVALAWAVCSIPDFRKLLFESHAEQLSTIFVELHEHGELRRDWLQQRLRPYADTVGDIDTLVARIAGLRTWAYVTHQSDWVKDAAATQATLRDMEDRLSDALHQALVDRFVAKAARKASSPRAVVQRMTTVQRDQPVDPHHPFARLSALREQLHEPRPQETTWQQLAQAADTAFELREDAIWWTADTIELAKVTKGVTPLRPQLRLVAKIVDSADQRLVEQRLHRWMDARTNALSDVWKKLLSADKPSLRQLGYLLERSFGQIRAADVPKLTENDVAAATKLGVVFTKYHASVALDVQTRQIRAWLTASR